jgi:hypothetical protein|tara:strand:+ start:1000 stop:1260 length:261 start_codon:yes stop_codon:yes gene_type:complete
MSCGFKQVIEENYHHLANSVGDQTYRTPFDKDMYNKFCSCHQKIEHFTHDQHQMPGPNPKLYRTPYDSDLQKKWCDRCPKQNFYNN